MQASEIVEGLSKLIDEYGDKPVLALGDADKNEFFEVDYIVEDGNEEETAPYILSLIRE